VQLLNNNNNNNNNNVMEILWIIGNVRHSFCLFVGCLGVSFIPNKENTQFTTTRRCASFTYKNLSPDLFFPHQFHLIEFKQIKNRKEIWVGGWMDG
jgi:hypothetical protein